MKTTKKQAKTKNSVEKCEKKCQGHLGQKISAKTSSVIH